MIWWPFAVSALVGGGAFLLGMAEMGSRLRGWREALIACGLSVVETASAWTFHPKVVARTGPVEVQIEPRRHGVRVMVLVQGPPGLAGMRIRREVHKPPGAREIEVGDPAFDGTFFVEGPPWMVCTLLDAEVRRLLLEANAESELEVAHGSLRTEVMDGRIATVLPYLLDIGRRWARHLDAAQCMAENAHQDPEPGVRLWNLLLLVRCFRDEPGTTEALRTACTDPSPEVRLRAALELGAEGRPVLAALAECSESTVADAVSAQAVTSLGRELPAETARNILIRSLRRRRLQTARAALDTLGGSGAPAAVETLAKVVAREKGELAVAAARALGSTGDAAAEPPLIAALRRDKADVRVAAAIALGRAGTAAAVLPLKEAAERGDRDLRRAARQAVAEIQSRLQGASPGQLSLAGADVGQLSLPQAEAGQLSFATDPSGQVSLPEA